METENDSVTKVLASFVVILAVAGVLITAFSGVMVYEKRTSVPVRPCIIDLPGSVVTRAEVWGNRAVCDFLARSGGVSLPTDPAYSLDAKKYDNSCRVEPQEMILFMRKLRVTCLTQDTGRPPVVLETFSATEAAEHIRDFHKKQT